MIWILGGSLVLSLIYSYMNSLIIKNKDKQLKSLDEFDKKRTEYFQKLKEENFNKFCKITNLEEEKERIREQIKQRGIKIGNLINQIKDLKSQLKLEDEASCKIIKDLEDEIEKERALNQTYSGYVKYLINAPRTVRRRFINGECIDWYDENGVLRMKIKEEK